LGAGKPKTLNIIANYSVIFFSNRYMEEDILR
jgi:hypothetical protein